MDILSHALWGATVVRNKELLPLVIGVSTFPDVGSLPQVFEVLRSYYKDYQKGIRRTFGELLTDWKKIQPSVFAFNFYYFFHSFFVWLVLTGALFLIARDYLVISICYLLHLLIDIPTHREARPFFPFSKFHIRGIYFLDDWRVFLINIFLLVIINLIIVNLT